ncbi:hypothetical protein N568_0106970 [Lactococcus garvieae TRF1]|uniref:Uncharacterized protein n=1 Tax=Lactococcus garvieae TRF1 TaxID=1380772 RepID=V8ANV1_9LACT|nr:hypothetical protein N568_0106970 [Lactococcus garvieae TRF1]
MMIRLIFDIVFLVLSICNIFWNLTGEIKIIPLIFSFVFLIVMILEIDSYITNKKKNNK